MLNLRNSSEVANAAQAILVIALSCRFLQHISMACWYKAWRSLLADEAGVKVTTDETFRSCLIPTPGQGGSE